MIAAPGIYADIPIGVYVADPCEIPSLSSSIAKILLDRSPAHAFVAHPRLTKPKPEAWSAQANFGSAVHSLVFGGQKVQPYGYDDWRKKEAQVDKADALKCGLIPLLTHEYDDARTIAAAVKEHLAPYGDDTLDEQTIVWDEGGALCRTRPDRMSGDMSTIIDLKVTGTNARECNRQFFSQGYDMQAALLERGADAVDPDGRGKRNIIYLFVENEPPFAAVPLQITEAVLTIARKKFHAAVNLWRDCLANNAWPSYPITPIKAEMPSWAEAQWLARELNDPTVKVDE